MTSRRFSSRATRDLHLEQLVSPFPELGLVAANGPNDPAPELVVDENGVVARMDGRATADFDVIDRFVVAHGLDLDVAAEAMALDDQALARMLVDVNVPRAELVRLSRGLTPAKLARVIGLLDPVELMLALKKLRARRVPGNQAHVTNLKESPALLAADAAEAARRGFAEMETTVGVARYAPLNAIALLVGEEELLRVRERAARAAQAVFAELGLPAITDEEVVVGDRGLRRARDAGSRSRGGRRSRG